MYTLQDVFHDLIKRYNNGDKINFKHLQLLENNVSDNLFDLFVKTFNNDDNINFIHLRNLEMELNIIL